MGTLFLATLKIILFILYPFLGRYERLKLCYRAIEKSFFAAFGGREKGKKRGLPAPQAGFLALRKGTAVPLTPA
jgi:hypothetical protein